MCVYVYVRLVRAWCCVGECRPWGIRGPTAVCEWLLPSNGRRAARLRPGRRCVGAVVSPWRPVGPRRRRPDDGHPLHRNLCRLHHHRNGRGSSSSSSQGCICRGGWGVEPPAKSSDPPAAIKKRKGVDFLCTYALARSSTSIAKTSTPLMKFDKYSPRSSSSSSKIFYT